MNPPLHTNTPKKIVFLFSVSASMFFNVLLFSSIGTNILIQTIWGFIGIGAVFFQTLKLREYFNCKKNIKYLHLALYLICTIGSIAGTLGAGYSHIEKTKLSNIDKVAMMEIIDKKINDIENNDTSNISELAIDSVIVGSNMSQWALINLLNKKSKLKQSKNDKYNNLITLKSNRANILKSQSGVISSLSGLSKILKMSEEMTAFIFLIFVSIILELMVFGSATFSGTLLRRSVAKKKKITKIKRERKKGQLFFIA
jgi:hypothetical protein